MVLKDVVEDQQRTRVIQRACSIVFTTVLDIMERVLHSTVILRGLTTVLAVSLANLQFFSYPLQNKRGPNTCPLNIIYTFGA
jgi:hypothetical protein